MMLSGEGAADETSVQLATGHHCGLQRRLRTRVGGGGGADSRAVSHTLAGRRGSHNLAAREMAKGARAAHERRRRDDVARTASE